MSPKLLNAFLQRASMLAALALALSSPNATAESLEVSWTHIRPTLDGRCDDPSYSTTLPLVDVATSEPLAEARLAHDRRDLFLCIEDFGETSLALRWSMAREPSERLGADELELLIDPLEASVKASRPDTDGDLVPLELGEGAVTLAASGNSLEARIALEWLGGYGRQDALWAALLDTSGAAQAQWPAESDASAPLTWGGLALTPLYPEETASGSLFLDGEGFAVLPYDPALNPAGELTVEAWVKVENSDCGTVLGNGRDTSFWLGVCGPAAFTHGGDAGLARGQWPLRDGWHHLAMVITAEGERFLYVDGERERHLGDVYYPEDAATRQPVLPGPSDAPLRVGADRDLGGDDGPLHGHMRELRIWNRARSQEELVADAFLELTEPEDGLVGVWPFTKGLQDVIGGRDAGLVGFAALAREKLDLARFPAPPPQPTEGPRSIAREVGPWDATIPHDPVLEEDILIDGVCGSSEYRHAAEARLEPLQRSFVQLLLGPDGLYVCAPAMFGGNRPEDGLTLWAHSPSGVDRDGEPLPAVRLRLDPTGAASVATWSEEEEAFLETDIAVEHAAIARESFKPQRDISEIPSSWWTAEMRIPSEALGHLGEGDTLSLAVKIASSLDARVDGTGDPSSEAWPEAFSPEDWGSWGETTFYPTNHDGDAPHFPEFDPSLAKKLCIPDDPHDHWPAPLQPPTIAQAHAVGCYENFGDCLANFPVPSLAACSVHFLAYFFDSDAKWPLVDLNHQVVYAEGTLDRIYVSREDSPHIHDSHDVDMNIDLDPAYHFLNIGGKASLKVEHESKAFPANQSHPSLTVRPITNDHVTLAGRWIFDCGHAAKTEIHPFVYFESDRRELRRTGWGMAHQVTTATVWMTSNAGHLGGIAMTDPFTFRLDMPKGSGLPFLRVVAGDPSKVDALLCGDTLHVTVTPPSSLGDHRFDLVAGRMHRDGPPAPGAFRLTFDSLDVGKDWDAGINDGDWYLDASVNGRWRNLFWDTDIDDGDDPGEHPIGSWSSRSIDLLGDRDLEIYLNGWESDDPEKGDGFDFHGGKLGVLKSVGPMVSGPGSITVNSDDNVFTYEIGYTVTPLTASDSNQDLAAPTVPAVHGALALNEPEAPPTFVSVPGPGDPTTIKSLPGFMTQDGLGLPEYLWFEADVDRYFVGLDDFATFTAHLNADPSVENDFQLEVKAKSQLLRGETTLSVCPYVPPELIDSLGAKQYSVKVTATPGQAAGPFSVTTATTHKVLPPDGGEPAPGQDEEPRTFDVTASPNSELFAEAVKASCGYQVNPASPVDPTVSKITGWRAKSDWAWQHVAGDVDVYRVVFPRPKQDPDPNALNCLACSTDGLEPGDPSSAFAGYLELRAAGMHLKVTTPGLIYEADEVLRIEGLGQLILPDAQEGGGKAEITVEVSSIGGVDERCAYRVEAEWKSSLYLKYGDPGCPWANEIVQASFCLIGCSEIPAASSSLPDWWWTKGPGLGDPAPLRESLDIVAGQGFAWLHLEEGESIDLVLSTEPGTTLDAKLFDPANVLVTESEPTGDKSHDKGGVPSDMNPSAEMSAQGGAGGAYLLMVDTGKDTDEEVEVGLGKIDP